MPGIKPGVGAKVTPGIKPAGQGPTTPTPVIKQEPVDKPKQETGKEDKKEDGRDGNL